MAVEIKTWDGRVLYVAKRDGDVRAAVQEAARNGADLSRANLSRADLSRADLSGADLSRANLSRADLSRADLSRANLSRANLSRADLSRANLSGADLSRANLSGANGVNPYLTTPLHMLKDQVGKIRAYKIVTRDGVGPYSGGIVYEKGKTYEAPADCDPGEQCGAGINVATLDWCMRAWRTGYRVIVLEFTAKDIACIPTGSDGKFRLHRAKVVGEKDLVELGLVEA